MYVIKISKDEQRNGFNSNLFLYFNFIVDFPKFSVDYNHIDSH